MATKCSCGHPTNTLAWTWAPGHLGPPLCVCCMRAIWEETLVNVKETLERYPAVTPEECAAGAGLVSVALREEEP